MTRLLSPTRYLAAANAVGAACLFAAGVYQARILGPEQLGVMAVIVGITVPVFIVFDVRLIDVAARLFYATDDVPEAAVPAYRAGVIWLAFLGALGLGVVAAVIVSIAGNALVPAFTASPVAAWWLPADAVGLTLSTSSGTLIYLLRFSRQFYLIGHWRIATQAVQMALTVLVLTIVPTVGGAFLAGCASHAIALALMMAVSWRVWTRRAGLPMARPDWRRARAAYRASLGMLFHGTLLGYGKLLHRGLDVLAVAYVTGDRETGLYKLSRQVVDGGVAILHDALYQVYFPDFLDLAARRATAAYRALARRLTAIGAGLTAAVLAAEAIVLPLLVPVVFGADFAGAEWPMMILTATFFFIAGCHPWLWALFVGAGRLAAYTWATFLAVATQYAVMLAAFAALGPSASAGAIGLLAYYLCLIPVAYAVAVRRFGPFVPALQTLAGARRAPEASGS